MIFETLEIDGKMFDAYSISLKPAPFLLIRSADKSFLACGFLDIAAADNLNACAAKVKGVKTFDDMLKAEVIAVTKEAEAKGVKVGMTGKEALLKF
ncbi:hypothetical protein MmiHf6_16410 [Methanimicrococcus hongohii]|uniref:DUF1805 domain-containing protein n=1 Tax=Methanimicrococcus hongohii TaxID=3028295 RepID=A0AA96V1U9_9EURY|nr:DUF1805 domain-containing protein [Methanimicrococcus sp. Hf6]WNY24310.1 hypothetical protein MmiHf6_16410 [Methanimicrococcus sp. Hf6]